MIEVWIAGGTAIGLVGYALSSQIGANAAIEFEIGLLRQGEHARQGELWRIVEANKPPFEVTIRSDQSEESADFRIVSMWFESILYGRLVFKVSPGDFKIIGGPFVEFSDGERLVMSLVEDSVPPIQRI